MIVDCEHEPKVRVGGSLLSICEDCRSKNLAVTYLRGGSLAEALAHHPAKGKRRVRLLRYQILREPTMEDFT